MELWKSAFILFTAAILPFALVAVGNPQEFTCWNLKPTENEEPSSIHLSSQNAPDRSEDDRDETDSVICTRTNTSVVAE